MKPQGDRETEGKREAGKEENGRQRVREAGVTQCPRFERIH